MASSDAEQLEELDALLEFPAEEIAALLEGRRAMSHLFESWPPTMAMCQEQIPRRDVTAVCLSAWNV